MSVRRIVALPVLATALTLVGFGVVRGMMDAGPGEGTRLFIAIEPPVDEAAHALAVHVVRERIDEKGVPTRVIGARDGIVVEIGAKDQEIVELTADLLERRATLELRAGETPVFGGEAIRTVEMTGPDAVTVGVARAESLASARSGAAISVVLDGTQKQTVTVDRVSGSQLGLRVAGATQDEVIKAGLDLVSMLETGAVRPLKVTQRTPFTRATGFWPRGLPFFVLSGIFVIAGVVLLWPRRAPSSAT